MISDEKIIEGCLAGKRKAYKWLYDKYAPTMMGICMRYCHDRPSAEDVLQEGFLKVFRNIGKFRGEGSFEGWIKRIIVNTSVDHYKIASKQFNHDPITDIRETDMTDRDDEEPFSVEAMGLKQEDIMQMIRELPEGYRMVFNLYAIEEFTHREIAGKLGISESTSKTQLMKARRLLRGYVENWIKSQEPKKIYR